MLRNFLGLYSNSTLRRNGEDFADMLLDWLWFGVIISTAEHGAPVCLPWGFEGKFKANITSRRNIIVRFMMKRENYSPTARSFPAWFGRDFEANLIANQKKLSNFAPRKIIWAGGIGAQAEVRNIYVKNRIWEQKHWSFPNNLWENP